MFDFGKLKQYSLGVDIFLLFADILKFLKDF